MLKPLFAIFLSLFLFAACDSGDTTRAMVRYNVELMNGTASSASGQFTFEEALQGSQSSGTFSLEAVGGGPVDPLASTSGDLNAFFESDGTIQVSVSDPLMSDAGLRFDADYAASGFSGTWGTITIIGYQEQGTFSATAVAE